MASKEIGSSGSPTTDKKKDKYKQVAPRVYNDLPGIQPPVVRSSVAPAAKSSDSGKKGQPEDSQQLASVISTVEERLQSLAERTAKSPTAADSPTALDAARAAAEPKNLSATLQTESPFEAERQFKVVALEDISRLAVKYGASTTDPAITQAIALVHSGRPVNLEALEGSLKTAAETRVARTTAVDFVATATATAPSAHSAPAAAAAAAVSSAPVEPVPVPTADLSDHAIASVDLPGARESSAPAVTVEEVPVPASDRVATTAAAAAAAAKSKTETETSSPATIAAPATVAAPVATKSPAVVVVSLSSSTATAAPAAAASSSSPVASSAAPSAAATAVAAAPASDPSSPSVEPVPVPVPSVTSSSTAPSSTPVVLVGLSHATALFEHLNTELAWEQQASLWALGQEKQREDETRFAVRVQAERAEREVQLAEAAKKRTKAHQAELARLVAMGIISADEAY